MSRFKHQIAAILAILASAAGAVGTPATADPLYAATLGYDAYGVPHVTATTETGLGYGLGYAYADQNLCLMLDQIVTTDGDRTRWHGGNGTAFVAFTSVSNTASDLYHRTFFSNDAIDRALVAAGPITRARLDGFARGFNRLLATKPRANRQCDGQPWVQPITARQLARSYLSISAWLGIGRLATVFDPSSATATAMIPPRPEAFGSNAFAYGSETALGGGSILLANPHTTWSYGLRMWQSHMTIPGRLDTFGAGFAGWPVHVVGYNRTMAWGATVTPAQRAVAFRLNAQVRADDVLSYQLDGQRIIVQPTRIDAGTQGGAVAVIWRTRQGTAMRIGADGTSIYIVADAFAENLNGLEGWADLARASNVRAGDHALAQNPGLAISITASDSAGEVYYGDMTPIPAFSNTQISRCLRPDDPLTEQSGILVFDGTRRACVPVNTNGTVKLAPAAQLPRMFTRKFALNANDSFRYVVDTPIPQNFTPLAAPPRDEDTPSPRSVYAFQRIGADLQQYRRIDGDTAAAIVFDNHNPAAEHLLPYLKAICTKTGPSVGCGALMAWNGKVDAEQRGVLMFASVWQALGDDAARLANTPTLTPSDITLLGNALAKGEAELVNKNVKVDQPWGDVLEISQGGDVIPLHGGDVEHGVLNVLQGGTLSAQGFQDIAFGASYFQLIEYDATGLNRARTMLAHGQSSEPLNQWRGIEARRFSAKQWIERNLNDKPVLVFSITE